MGYDNSGSPSLDAVDRTIIDLLQEDGRRSNAGIARVVGVSQSTVKKRIDRLVERGIMRVLAVVDPSAAGHGQHLFVGMNVKPGSASAVGDTLAAMHEVAFLAYLVGRYDILIEVFAADTDALLEFLTERIAAIEDVVSVETFSVLRNQKVNYYNWNLPLVVSVDRRT
ncbi:MAG TPA: Lrp/AsnC family transcriptional regulator [Thermoleophilia bacterium]|nr:Lrp/AsnC family transcriptional regulator [Thermoleophilia bacterium]